MGVEHRHRHLLGVDRPDRLDVGRPDLRLLGVGYAGRHVLGVDRPGRRVVGVDRLGPVRLDVDRAGHHVVGVDRRCPDRLRRAYPAGRRTGCFLGVDRLGEVRPDVVHGYRHDRLHGSGRDVRRNLPNAYPAGMRMGCCLGVVPLALDLACCPALVLHLEQVRPGWPWQLELLGSPELLESGWLLLA